MAKKVYDEENIRAIADKIREKTGGDLTYKTSEMPQGIEDVYEAGKVSGGGDNHYDTFWDNYQKNGNRTDYQSAFGGIGWTAENFKPKYDIRPKLIFEMFRGNTLEIDLEKHLENLGIELDFSGATGGGSVFYNSRFTKIGIVDFTSATSAITYLFYNCTKLEEITRIVLKNDGSQAFSNWFTSCSALKEIRFDGVIGDNVSFSSCTRLTHDSLMSIINALKDFRATQTFANVDWQWNGNANGGAVNKLYTVEGTIFDSNKLSLYLETDEMFVIPDSSGATIPATLILEINNFTYNDDVSKIKAAMISSDGTLTLVFEPTDSKTLTLGATNIAKLTDEEKKIATDKGWILA